MAKQAVTKASHETIGRNVVAERHGDVLMLRIDLSDEGAESKSGKSIVIGTTNGNVRIPGTDVIVGLNVYKPNHG